MKTRVIIVLSLVVSQFAHGQSLPRVVRGHVYYDRSECAAMNNDVEVVGFFNGALMCRSFTVTTSQGPTDRRGNLHYSTAKNYIESFALTNYPGAARLQKGDIIHRGFAVWRVDSFMYDYGQDYVAPTRQLSPEEAAAAKKEAEKRQNEGKGKTLRWHQDLADQGDARGQYYMGMHYLKGDGVPMDRAKAMDYFSKAAAQNSGDPSEDAKKELRRLASGPASPQTDSPPRTE